MLQAIINSMRRVAVFAGIAFCLAAAGCTTVKPYQRAHLNDAEMKQGRKDIEKFEDNTHTYREGASGGGAKAGGGCGCN